MMGAKEKIGQLIKTMRKSRNMTQEDLARAIDQSASSITMYENGRREPNFETLEALADVFNVSLFEFIPVAQSDKDFLDEELFDQPRTPEARVQIPASPLKPASCKGLRDFCFLFMAYRGLPLFLATTRFVTR